jgi:hypothetical protein
MLSPIALVFVQIFDDEASEMVVPDAMDPVRAGAAGVDAGRGAGVDVVGVVLAGVVRVPEGRVTGEAGAFVLLLFAVSLNVRFALSRLAIARFAASAESFFRAVESVFDASPEQPTSVIVAIAKDAAVIRV